MHANPLPSFLGNFSASLPRNVPTTMYDMDKYDSIPSIDQFRCLLWNVMGVLKAVARALAYTETSTERKGGEALFFDLYVIQLQTLLTINIVLLTVGPLLLLLVAMKGCGCGFYRCAGAVVDGPSSQLNVEISVHMSRPALRTQQSPLPSPISTIPTTSSNCIVDATSPVSTHAPPLNFPHFSASSLTTTTLPSPTTNSPIPPSPPHLLLPLIPPHLLLPLSPPAARRLPPPTRLPITHHGTTCSPSFGIA
ncbi:hypothetical protein BDQ17DRAFT_1428250 [Cyathus striatus]|nr:hypothetical protein BDQ17DRAFT_1428250 [Cyathus striatus]